MLFREASDKYMADKGKRLRASTLEGYRSALELHVLPRWAGVELGEMTPEGVQAWVDGFARPGSVIGKNGVLCTITCDRAFADTGSLLLRGAFPNKQSGIKAEYSGGHTIVLRAEQQVTMALGDTFSVIVPVTWAL